MEQLEQLAGDGEEQQQSVSQSQDAGDVQESQGDGALEQNEGLQRQQEQKEQGCENDDEEHREGRKDGGKGAQQEKPPDRVLRKRDLSHPAYSLLQV